MFWPVENWRSWLESFRSKKIYRDPCRACTEVEPRKILRSNIFNNTQHCQYWKPGSELLKTYLDQVMSKAWWLNWSRLRFQACGRLYQVTTLNCEPRGPGFKYWVGANILWSTAYRAHPSIHPSVWHGGRVVKVLASVWVWTEQSIRPRLEFPSGHYPAIRLNRFSHGLPGFHPSIQGPTLGTRLNWTSRLGLGVWVLRMRVYPQTLWK